MKSPMRIYFQKALVLGGAGLILGGLLFFSREARADRREGGGVGEERGLMERAIEEACQPLEEGIPQVAIHRLRRLLEGERLESAWELRIRVALGRAYLQVGKSEEALQALGPLESRQDPEGGMLKGEAFVAARRWSEALLVFEQLREVSGVSDRARIGQAECEYALGGREQAASILSEVVGRRPDLPLAALRLADVLLEGNETGRVRGLLSGVSVEDAVSRKWRTYLEGRLALVEGQPEFARERFSEVIREPLGLTAEMLVGAVFGAADARLILEGYESADRELEAFIWQNPESPYLETMFARLDDIYSHEADPPDSELQKWVQAQPSGRSALARYYLAKSQIREGKPEKAAAQLSAFVQNHPRHPLTATVQTLRSELLVRRKDYSGAVAALEAAARHAGDEHARALTEFRTGLVQYRAGEYLLAANLFENAGRRWPQLWEFSLYNQALAALNLRNYERFEELCRSLGEGFPESVFRGELALEQGLLLARVGEGRAVEALQAFVRKFSSHSRVAEARLALAELAFQAGEPRAAEGYRRVSNSSPAGGALDDQSEYLQIFLLESQGRQNDDALIAQALKFLRERPRSSLVPEVRMKLGQTYFRRDDFANAETQLATLAREDPEGPYAETALFISGQAAMRSINAGAVDRALEHFDQVVKRDGPLKLYAREQQALVQRQLDREVEALKLYDIILSAQPPPDAELVCSAMTGKGDALLVLGKQDTAQTEGAVSLFRELASRAGVGPAWRNQALYKQAKAEQWLGRLPEAMSTYYEVLRLSSGARREWVWYFKAGFELAALYEQQKDWKSAIGVYEKMILQDGPQSDEARARVKKLRLEHFVWE
jgi:tetratricopeptide (TPR) repeat protein